MMRFLRAVRIRLRTLFSRAAVEQDLDEELRYHLERQIEEEIAQGMSPEAARQAALRSFQDFEQRKEECRDLRGWNFIDNLTQDLRYTIRQLGKNAGFTTTAILILALGMCASIAIFAFVDAALLKPLPYRDPSRLVGVFGSIPGCPHCDLAYFDYQDLKKLNKTLGSLEVYGEQNGLRLTTASGSEPVYGLPVSAGFFRTLGVTPVLGRDFHAGEDLPGAARTVVINNSTWRTRYGGRGDVLGQTVMLDGASYTIIGVLPADFQFAPSGSSEFWTAFNPDDSCAQSRGCHNLFAIGRLKDSASVESARADIQLIAHQLEAQYPDSNRGQSTAVVPLTDVIVGDIRPILLVLLAGAGLLLLIACVNVTSLLVVRSESRKRELAVRTALGASRGRLISQFVTEGLVLVSLSTLLGLITASWAMQLLVRLVPANLMLQMPFFDHIGFNYPLAIFACAMSILAVVLFAITPAVRLRFAGMREGLAEGTRGSAGTTWQRVGSKLVALELATAMVLLVGAGLLGQSLYHLLHVDLGFQADHLATIRTGLPDADGSPVATNGRANRVIELEREMLGRISNLPGVKSAGLVSNLPVSFNGNTLWIRFLGKPFHGEHNEVLQRFVSADYFKTIEAQLLGGRYFMESEDSSKPAVVIINESLAKKYFPGEDPIGKRIGNFDLTSIREVVGVVADIREGALDSEIWPAIYLPFNQNPRTYFSLVARTSQDEKPLSPLLAKAIHDINPAIITVLPGGMHEKINNSASAYIHRSSAWLVGAFAGIALLLGLVGLYGVIAYSVSQRTREIGVRMALGAERQTVYCLVLKEAAVLTVIGIFAGVLGSLAAATLMRKLLFGIRSWDVATLFGVAAILAISAMIASFVPARRAASVNPVDALRAE